jgi:hypothetical protein
MVNNFWCFHLFPTQNRANSCLSNVEQDLLIRNLIFSISRIFDSKIWNNWVRSRSPTCIEACRAWETSLKSVFRVYLKGRYGPNPTSLFFQELKQAQPPPAKKMKMRDLENFPMFPSSILTRTPKTYCGRLGGDAVFVLPTLYHIWTRCSHWLDRSCLWEFGNM